MSPTDHKDEYVPDSERNPHAQAWFWRAYLVWLISIVALLWAVS